MIKTYTMKKHDLKNLTFILPVMIDTDTRFNNFKYCYDFLINNYDCDIIIAETGPSKIISNFELLLETKKIHVHLISGLFPKTKMINLAVKSVTTKYFAVHDIDCYFNPEQIISSYNHLMNLDKSNSLVYPYSGIFYNVFDFDYELTSDIKKFSVEQIHENSIGGCFMMDKETFVCIGGMNENIISWGFDDDELYERSKKLGLQIYRQEGVCYHFHHPRPYNSSDQNPNFEQNRKEYLKIMDMNEEKLRKTIKNWNWIK